MDNKETTVTYGVHGAPESTNEQNTLKWLLENHHVPVKGQPHEEYPHLVATDYRIAKTLTKKILVTVIYGPLTKDTPKYAPKQEVVSKFAPATPTLPSNQILK